MTRNFLTLVCACVAPLLAARGAGQTLRLDPPSAPAWPKPSSVSVLADSLVREADKLDAGAAKPSAPAAWRRLAASLLRAHGDAPLADSAPAAIALVMVAIRRDMDARLDTPAGELWAAQWNMRPDPRADPLPELPRILATIAQSPAPPPEAPPCPDAQSLLKDFVPIAASAATAPDLERSTADIVAAAKQAAAALCALPKAPYWNQETRAKIAAQAEAAAKGLLAPATRAESLALCAKLGALAQAIDALADFRASSTTTASRSDRIPESLLALQSRKDATTAALALTRVSKVLRWMAEAQRVRIDGVPAPLHGFARSLVRRAQAAQKLGIARIESLALSGFDANDPSLATIFVAQEQLVGDIAMLQRLGAALEDARAGRAAQTRQLTAVLQSLAGGLDDQSFSELFRERLRSMDRQLAALRGAEETPNLPASIQAEAQAVRQRWLDAWAQNDPAKGLACIKDFVRWTAAKRALDALDAAPAACPDARLDWAASRQALRQCVSDGEGALASGNIAALKPFLSPLKREAAAALAAGLRLAARPKPSDDVAAVTRSLLELQNDRGAQVISAMLRLEQERQSLLKSNPALAGDFLKARLEWIEALPPALQDRLPDGMLPPAAP
jgi:hypothetical protein